jgi:hypothetical protein
MDPEVYLEKLIKLFPDKKIVASGTAVHHVQRNFVPVTLLLSDAEIHQFVKRTSTTKP